MSFLKSIMNTGGVLPRGGDVLVWACTSALLITLLGACNRPGGRAAHATAVKTLTRVAQKEEFAAYGFLSGTQGMAFVDQALFVSDAENSRVLVLDPAMNALHQIGKPGQGPGELSWAGPVAFDRDRLFVTNLQRSEVAVFDVKGTFLDTIPAPFCSFSTQFAVYDGRLFLSTPKLEKTISVVGNDGQILYQFGEPFPAADARERARRGSRHLAVVETANLPILMSVRASEPIIEGHMLDGTLLFAQNLAEHPLLQTRLETAERFRKAHPERRFNTTVLLFDAMTTNGQELYVLVEDQAPPFHILHFHVDEAGAHEQTPYRIQDDIALLAMAATPDQTFYLLDGKTRQLQKYALKRRGK